VSATVGRLEIVTIGDELLEGRLVDTNAGTMSGILAAAGFRVIRHTSVADDPTDIVDALRAAAERTDAVLVSGGLGPTSDDLTAPCAAEAAGVGLERRPEAVAHLKRYFTSRDREMAPSNLKQADLPEGATILPNDRGTAVGFKVAVHGRPVYCMPGVPEEMEAMLEHVMLPDLAAHLTAAPPRIATLKIFGLGESDVAQRLEGDAPLAAPENRLRIQYRATFPEIHVRLVLEGGDDRDLQALLDEAHRRVGRAVFAVAPGAVGENLADVTVALLLAQGSSVAILDGFSGGRMIGALLDADPSDSLIAGCEMVRGELELPRAAEQARERFRSTFGMALTRTEGGLVRVGLAGAGEPVVRDLRFPFSTRRMRRLAAWAGLELLRRACLAN
jgi:nicotinamide-nucleotide amidase